MKSSLVESLKHRLRFSLQQRKALHATYAYMQHYSSGTGFVKPFGNEIKERKKEKHESKCSET